MSSLKHFLLQCSGVDMPTLEACPSDQNKYVGIGATILFTAILAFCSGAYALYTVFDNVFAAILFGVIWGLMIFNLDRYIVGSMKKMGNGWSDFGVALPRIIMAILLAIVISKPLELKVFEKEINAELIVMEQEVFKEQEDRVIARYQPLIDQHQAEISQLQSEINEKASVRDEMALMAIQEADGTGGSMQRNLGPIYRAKKTRADAANNELESVLSANQPMIDTKLQEVESLRAQMKSDIDNLERTAYGGLAGRMDALSRLSQQSEAIAFASIFIMLLFIAIETAPIFVKLIAQRGPYDFMMDEKEHVFAMANKEHKTLLANAVQNTIHYETSTKTHTNNAKVTAEKAEVDAALAQKLEELKGANVSWDKVIPSS